MKKNYFVFLNECVNSFAAGANRRRDRRTAGGVDEEAAVLRRHSDRDAHAAVDEALGRAGPVEHLFLRVRSTTNAARHEWFALLTYA